MQQVEGNADSLLDLYIRRREELLADLNQCSPTEAADHLNRFIHSLERLYTDLPTITDFQARLAPHLLGVIAAAASTLTAVTATATVPYNRVPEPTSRESSTSLLNLPLALRYLWGIMAACVIAVVVVLLSAPAIIPVILLVTIGFLAASGAATVRSRMVQDSFSPPLPEPQVNLFLAVNTIDGKLSAALRAADDLLALTSQAPRNGPMLETERVFELLQALCAHQTIPTPEKTADDLAKDAARLLYTAQITPVTYSPETAHFFDKRPAGISERRPLLPALVSDNGALVRKGIILEPIA